MLEPLKQFICDTCGVVIESINDGSIEWEDSFDNGEIVDKKFRICHHCMSCQKLANHIYGSDLPLRDVVGDNVYAFLYSHFDNGPYHIRVDTKPSMVYVREYTELTRRLTIPYYEEARQWWSEAMNDGYFGTSCENGIYLPKNLKRMIEHYSE